ncbi:MAG TPA: CesT family type III secretion system chaperone [Minicystis sp.]|nr:CesT family type III secretion system chaperone [Minicystis sp.]
MPRTAEDVENYLLQLDRRFENDAGTFLVSGSGNTPIAIRVAPPIVAIRVAIGDVPRDAAHQLKVMRRLLEYNATDLMHVSYGLDADHIVLTAALELENLDLNELEAALSDVDLALARHVPELVQAAAPPAR